MTVEKDAAAKPAGDEKILSEEEPDAGTVEAEADEADAEEAADQEAAEGDEGEEEGEKTESDDSEGDGKKLSKSTRQKHALKARIATLEEIAHREADRADAAADALKAITGEIGPPPDKSKYEGREDEYIADLAAYKAEQRAVARQKKTAETAHKDAGQAAWESKQALFKERVRALKDSHPGIEARVFSETAPFNRVMADVLMDAERGAEVADYLATHTEEARRIQQMTPLLAARELGRLEARLELPKPRTQTQAPKPPPKVSGSTAKPVKDPEKMTTEEWMDWERQRMARKAKAGRA